MNAPIKPLKSPPVTPHAVLRRLSCRVLLEASKRRPNERPELTWPSFIEAKLEGLWNGRGDKPPKMQMEDDQFATMMTVSQGRSEKQFSKRGEPILDKDGAPRTVWVTRDAEVLEPLSYYGSFVRQIAKSVGLKPKSLSKWTEDEVWQMSAMLARMLTRGEPSPQGIEHPNYPGGWQDSQAAALAYGREQGFWNDR